MSVAESLRLGRVQKPSRVDFARIGGVEAFSSVGGLRLVGVVTTWVRAFGIVDLHGLLDRKSVV